MVLPAIIAGASILGGSIISSLSGMNQAKKQRAQNMELAKYSYQKDLEMWNTANRYNSPQQQMDRLKKAGLNPNMVYGTGTVTGNTSTQTPKYQRPEVPRSQLKLEVPDVTSQISKYQDFKNKGIQNDNLKAQTELMTKESEIKSLTQLKIIAATAKSQSERKRIEGLINGQILNLELGNRHEKLKMNITEKDWSNYSKYGLRPTDSILYRGAANMKDTFSNWFKKKIQSGQQNQLKKPSSWRNK